MSHVPRPLRRIVVQRAGGRCEYCRVSQKGQGGTFHLDHIIPEADEGPTAEENLALSCIMCSLRKGSRTRAVDPETNAWGSLYNPRQDAWSEHFEWRGVRIVGRTPTGRATVVALKLNHPDAMQIRRDQRFLGRQPD
jgi:hypothetical protein